MTLDVRVFKCYRNTVNSTYFHPVCRVEKTIEKLVLDTLLGYPFSLFLFLSLAFIPSRHRPTRILVVFRRRHRRRGMVEERRTPTRHNFRARNTKHSGMIKNKQRAHACGAVSLGLHVQLSSRVLTYIHGFSFLKNSKKQ